MCNSKYEAESMPAAAARNVVMIMIMNDSL